MPYTNTWNESIPVGADAANTADDWLRQEKLDLRERLNSIMGYSVSAPLTDPVIPVGKGIMVVQTYTLFIPVWQMSYVSASGTLAVPASTSTPAGVAVVQATHGIGYFHCGVVLPVGVTLINSELNYELGAGTLSYAGRHWKRAKTASAQTLIAAWSGSGALVGVQNGGASWLNEVTVTDTYYSSSFSVTPAAGQTVTVFGLSVNYSVPDISVRI